MQEATQNQSSMVKNEQDVKLSSFSFEWDRLRNGDFPKKQIEEIDTIVSINKLQHPFREQITIAVNPEKGELFTAEAIFAIGMLVRTLTIKYII